MRSTRRRRTWVLLATLLLVFGTCGCAIKLGGGQTRTVVEPSVGQELEDLKSALEAGIITPSEYEALKKSVLER